LVTGKAINEIDVKKLLTVLEVLAAVPFLVTLPSIYRWLREGKLKGARYGGRVFVPAESVLIALYANGFSEAFAGKNVDVKAVSVPHCRGLETLAEDTFEQMLPHRYRQLYWPVKVRASAMHRPLLPSTNSLTNLT